jgi:hypothetical protein
MSPRHGPATALSAVPLAPDGAPAAELPLEAPPRSHGVTIRFAGEHGVEGTVRVAVRGQTIHATILSTDAEAAHRMSDQLSTLRRSLEGQGFPDTRLAVHWSRPLESGPAARDPRHPAGDQHLPSSKRHEDPAEHPRRDPRHHPDDRQETR